MPGDQLTFHIPHPPGRRLPERIRPMQPTSVGGAFDDPGYLFEPWWPGTRAVAFAEGGRLRLQVEQLSDALAAFPELADLPAQLLGDGVVLDGSLLVLDADGRPDAELLRRRLLEGRAVGVAAYVAADLLWLDGRSIVRRPYRARREELLLLVEETDRLVVGRGYERDGTLVAEALASLGIDGLSARRLEARYRSGPAGDAWLRAALAVEEPPARPTLALIQRLPL